MSANIFNQQVKAMNYRLEQLYQHANTSVKLPTDLLPLAFKELGIASEEMQIVLEELQQQNQELLATRAELEKQRQRYQELFEFAPHGYLVTDAEGTIKEANRIAAKLLNVSQRFLVGKPMIVFVAQNQRLNFHSQLSKLQQGEKLQDWAVSFCPRDVEPFDAVLTADSLYDREGKAVEIRLGIRDIKDKEGKLLSDKWMEAEIEKNDHNPSLELPKQVYLKGENIPLKPQTIYQVCQGIVRLSTLFENGEEVLVGLAGTSMIFGAELTSLQTYQATALCEVHLLHFSVADILASSNLSQTFLHQVNQRLRQTEALLAVSGQRHVKDRLHYLLLLLKQEFGQPVAQGTRLGIRLTHQEIADACSTTRVTVTRILGKLQERGDIVIDSRNHIILKNKSFQSAFRLNKKA